MLYEEITVMQQYQKSALQILNLRFPLICHHHRNFGAFTGNRIQSPRLEISDATTNTLNANYFNQPTVLPSNHNGGYHKGKNNVIPNTPTAEVILPPNRLSCLYVSIAKYKQYNTQTDNAQIPTVYHEKIIIDSSVV